MDYRAKYLKYKAKYLDLKAKVGGNDNDLSIVNNFKKAAEAEHTNCMKITDKVLCKQSTTCGWFSQLKDDKPLGCGRKFCKNYKIEDSCKKNRLCKWAFFWDDNQCFDKPFDTKT